MKIVWEEPLKFAQAIVRSTGTVPSYRVRWVAGIIAAAAIAVITAGFELFFRWLHNKDLGVPAYFYFAAPPIAGLFVGFLPYMLSVIPAKIILTEKGIHRNKPIGSEIAMQFWPWDSIFAMAIEEIRYGDEVHRVLVVRSELEQGDILLGLGAAPLDQIHAAANQMGKTIVNRVRTSDAN